MKIGSIRRFYITGLSSIFVLSLAGYFTLPGVFSENPGWGKMLVAFAGGLFMLCFTFLSFFILNMRFNGLSLEIARQKDARDIAEFERMKLEIMNDRIVESNRNLRRSFDAVIDGVIVLDEAWVIKDVNRVAGAVMGYSSEELVGSFAPGFCTEETKARFVEGMDSLKKKGEARGLDLALMTKKGKPISVTVNASAIKNNKGDVAGYVAVMSDMTKKKELGIMKSRFLSNISHDLRTPLTSIKGFVSTILNDPGMSDATRIEFLGIVEDEADNLSGLVTNLIDLSMLEMGAVSVAKGECDIRDTINSVVREKENESNGKHIKIETHLPDELPMVLADSGQIKKVIANLMDNAIKFTGDGGRIDVLAKESGENIEISVSDNGKGISKDDMKRIFDKEYLMERYGEKGFGVALGLPLVKSIIEAHGGVVFASSTVGEGSKFSFVIPKMGV